MAEKHKALETAETGIETAVDYWIARELGERLRLSEKSVYRLTRAHPPIPHVKVGGSVRFPVAETLTWLRNRTKGIRGRQPS